MIIGADELQRTISRRVAELDRQLWRLGAVPVLCVAVTADPDEVVKVIWLNAEAGTDEEIAAGLDQAAAAIRAGRVERSGTAGGGA
jgi:hypothetical protein